MKKLVGKALMHNGHFVDEYMLHEGIYSTDKPIIHWDKNLTVKKYIKDSKFTRGVMKIEYPRHEEENISKCEFATVTLTVE